MKIKSIHENQNFSRKFELLGFLVTKNPLKWLKYLEIRFILHILPNQTTENMRKLNEIREGRQEEDSDNKLTIPERSDRHY